MSCRANATTTQISTMEIHIFLVGLLRLKFSATARPHFDIHLGRSIFFASALLFVTNTTKRFITEAVTASCANAPPSSCQGRIVLGARLSVLPERVHRVAVIAGGRKHGLVSRRACGECPRQSGSVATKNTPAVERREQCAEATADDRAFDGADDQGTDGSECEDVCGGGIRHKYGADYESQESPIESHAYPST